MKAILAGAAAALAFCAFMRVAQAGDMAEIDCGASSFGFAGAGYQVDCQRSTEQMRIGQSSGATEIDVMTISAENPRMFMTMVGLRITATRIYMEHRSLRENFRDTFKHVEAENWQGTGNRQGWDSAEFTAVISGLPSDCVAVQRYTNAAWTGFKRRVIGMGCALAGREAVYAALALLRAPGD